MKWLFATLLGLNLIVFAGMIAGKMWKESKPEPVATNNPAPTQIVIHTNDLNGAAANAASNVAGVKVQTAPPVKPAQTKTEPPKVAVAPAPKAEKRNTEAVSTAQPQANYKNCSARVSMPEDDYHRIKGLLGKYPHAASRQVVESSAEDGAQSTSRMNVLFMSVSDQDAGAIQAVVGRYGQLNRAPCNK